MAKEILKGKDLKEISKEDLKEEEKEKQELTQEQITEALYQQNQQLRAQNYLESLKEEKIFRLEILQTIQGVGTAIANSNQQVAQQIAELKELVEKISSPDLEEENKSEDKSED